MGNEPNVTDDGSGHFETMTPDAYAIGLNSFAAQIKKADPTARLVGPNVLNWTFKCAGCKGDFPSGAEWTSQFVDAYRARFRQEPPLDVYAVHAYDLDWESLPQGNATRAIDQISGMRAFLDADAQLAGKPMWVSEIGIHWGYPGFEQKDGRISPKGEFDYDHVENYMRTLFGWLNANAVDLRIERWFVAGISTSTTETFNSVWGGITFMDGLAADSPINRLGQLYRQLAGVAP